MNNFISHENFNLDLSDNNIDNFLSLITTWLNLKKDNNGNNHFQVSENAINKIENLIWKTNKKSTTFLNKEQTILSLLQSLEKKLNNINQDNNELQQCLLLLKEAKLEICIRNNYTYYTLPYVARFIIAAVQVFKACITTNIYTKTSIELVKFFWDMRTYMEDVIKTAFNDRKLYINTSQVKDTNIVYFYDGYINQDLTYRVPLQKGIEFEFVGLQEILRDRIAESYIKELPIDIIQQSLNLFSGTQLFKTWEEYKEKLIIPNNKLATSINNDLLYSLIVDNIRKQHFSNVNFNLVALPTVVNNKILLAAPDDTKLQAQKALSQTIVKIAEYCFTYIVKGLLDLGGFACLTPFIGGFLDYIFGNTSSTPITKQEMIDAIDRRIANALNTYQTNIIKAKFGAAVDAYLLRMEALANNNKGVKDKSKWDLGRPEDWEAAVDTLEDLKEYFFMNDYSFQYQTATLFLDFVTMYLTLIYGKLQTVKKGDDISVEKNMLQSFFTGWYEYMQKLTDQSWNKTVDNGDFYRYYFETDPYTYSHAYELVNAYNTKSDYINIISGKVPYKYYDSLYNPMRVFDIRYRMYATVNSRIYSLCKAYDEAVTEYNKMFKDNLPLAYDSIFSLYVEYKYFYEMQQVFDDGICKDDLIDNTTCSLYYGYGLCGLHDPLVHLHFSIEDVYVTAYRLPPDNSTSTKFCPGDYLLTEEQSKQLAILQIPRGYIVKLFEKNDYTGETLTLPKTGDENNNYRFTIKSYSSKTFSAIQVRLDTSFWFYNKITSDYLRLKNYVINEDGTLNYNMIVDFPLNPYIDPD